MLIFCYTDAVNQFLLVCILVNAFMLAVQGGFCIIIKSMISVFKMMVLVLNMMVFALIAPSNTLDEDWGFEANKLINATDFVLSVIFSLEMSCKCYTLGLVVG